MEVKETFTREEVENILAQQEEVFKASQDRDSKVRFRATCIIEVIKNAKVLRKEFVDKAAKEFEEFLYPQIENKDE